MGRIAQKVIFQALDEYPNWDIPDEKLFDYMDLIDDLYVEWSKSQVEEDRRWRKNGN